MPDDLAQRLENLHAMMPPDLGRKLDKVDKLDQRLAGLVKSAQEAAVAQQAIRHRLEELDRQVAQHIDEDRAARARQYALTALAEARADHHRRFGHRQAVRRTATGMLRAMTSGTASPAALLRAAEHLMIDAPGYWLPPALVALAAWTGDRPATVGRAVREAVHRDPGRSALFFGLTLARLGRQDTAARWITEYARAQDCNALTGEFTVVLDVVAQGALGGQARERLLDACRGWRDQIRRSGTSEERQVASWTGFIRGQGRPLTETFGPLETVSHDWAAARSSLEAVTVFGHTERWLHEQLAGPSPVGETPPRDPVGGLLDDLIAAPDHAESELLEAASHWQAVVAGDGHPPAPPSGANGHPPAPSSGEPGHPPAPSSGADSHPPAPSSGEPGRTDFLSLATAIATGTGPREFSAPAVRFCLVLSGPSVERAVTDLSQQVRSTCPASIDIGIEGWHRAVRPSDDPATLIPEFLDWTAKEIAEARTQASRRRLGIGRSAARLEQLESSWEERRQRGQDAVYQATLQANLYYGKWQQGIKAAERCASLLRSQATAPWGDEQEPGTVPGRPRPATELPDWDPRPPGP